MLTQSENICHPLIEREIQATETRVLALMKELDRACEGSSFKTIAITGGELKRQVDKLKRLLCSGLTIAHSDRTALEFIWLGDES